MYSKNQVSQIKQEFWTAFGWYMKPVPSAEGPPVNWKNYKTGIRHLYFRLKAERDFASISIEIQHPDADIGELLYEQLFELKHILEMELREAWTWIPRDQDNPEHYRYTVEKKLEMVNVLEKKYWPEIISFLKPRILGLDAFWATARYGFEGLV
ncbi:MAG: DUF4268 domain-containing protein [Cyclobacterium sp.]|uniref:DUF4268 domain-containing protein n=1 Tax=Cyclobacterium sp. TaxID=1966343 RepID=UPI00397049C5